jgi:hypothetical protein
MQKRLYRVVEKLWKDEFTDGVELLYRWKVLQLLIQENVIPVVTVVICVVIAQKLLLVAFVDIVRLLVLASDVVKRATWSAIAQLEDVRVTTVVTWVTFVVNVLKMHCHQNATTAVILAMCAVNAQKTCVNRENVIIVVNLVTCVVIALKIQMCQTNASNAVKLVIGPATAMVSWWLKKTCLKIDPAMMIVTTTMMTTLSIAVWFGFVFCFVSFIPLQTKETEQTFNL